jgi:hypothetical protein
MRLRAGDWVEVRSKAEILGTLDNNGQLEGLPFMPQMFRYCGQQLQVYKRAHKTCDTVNRAAGLRLSNGVHLQLRCDGAAYGGCQAACLIFWKEEWLKPLLGRTIQVAYAEKSTRRQDDDVAVEPRCTEEDVLKATRVDQPGEDPRYSCQATQLPYCTSPLPWWDIRQYVEDYTSGNTTLSRMIRGFIYSLYYYGSQSWRLRLGRPARWLYDRFQAVRGGIPFPRTRGTIPLGEPTPTCVLDLRPGELVRVKSFKEILATLDTSNKNRGLFFDAEAVPYCGGTYRVRTRVNNFIDEKTGKMKSLRTPAVILDDVWCRSGYSDCRMFCPRSIYTWWREIWLERVSETDNPQEKNTQEMPSA